MPTAAIQDHAKANPGAVYIQGFSILPGGLPISLDGSVVAGIGVAGAPAGEIDASCAADGIDGHLLTRQQARTPPGPEPAGRRPRIP